MCLKTATSINELCYKLQSKHKNLGARMKLFPLHHRASATGLMLQAAKENWGKTSPVGIWMVPSDDSTNGFYFLVIAECQSNSHNISNKMLTLYPWLLKHCLKIEVFKQAALASAHSSACTGELSFPSHDEKREGSKFIHKINTILPLGSLYS